MKSPICSVGSIDPDGMRKGSKRKLRSKKDDQNDREKSGGVLEPPRLTSAVAFRRRRSRRQQHRRVRAPRGWQLQKLTRLPRPYRRRCRQKYRALKNSEKMPVMTVRIKRISAKFMALNGFVLPCPIAFLFVYRNSQTSSALTPSFLSIAYYFSSTSKIARKASCGISTLPTCFIRFLPAFCFSSSLRLRVMSPP